MSKFSTRLGKIKRDMELRSIAKGRQSNAINLQLELKKLYDKTMLTDAMSRALNASQQEYAIKQRELMESYMEKEIKILKDIKLQLQK